MCISVDADGPMSEGLRAQTNSGFEGQLSETQPGVTKIEGMALGSSNGRELRLRFTLEGMARRSRVGRVFAAGEGPAATCGCRRRDCSPMDVGSA